MTREEFESILEECFIEGYNSALDDIQEDILDEEAFDLEGDYGYYTEKVDDEAKGPGLSKINQYPPGAYRKALTRLTAMANSDRDYPNAQKYSNGKMEKDFGGKVPDRVKRKLIADLTHIRKDKERGKIPSKSAFLKY